jgi:CelD/BcsL family acetyltransferase involved in cellulose biosynthesis
MQCADKGIVVASFDALDALPPEALALMDGSGEFFTSRLWWRATTEHAIPPGSRACFVLVRVDGEPVLLCPLLVTADDALSALVSPYTCVFFPLVSPNLPGKPAFAALTRFFRQWPSVRFDALPADWPWLKTLMDAGSHAGLVKLRFNCFGNWHEHTGDCWDAYLGARPGTLRETIRRKLRRAEQGGSVFSVIDAAASIENGIAAYEAVYARSWKEPEPFPRFNPALMRAAAAEGSLRLGLLEISGKPVAAQFWVVHRGGATVLKLAHDDAFKTASPGTVLTALMIRRLMEVDGVTRLDFGRGDDPYKQGWARERRQRIGVVFANPRRAAGLALIVRHAAGHTRRKLAGAA